MMEDRVFGNLHKRRKMWGWGGGGGGGPPPPPPHIYTLSQQIPENRRAFALSLHLSVIQFSQVRREEVIRVR
jgi:hypothetical protein